MKKFLFLVCAACAMLSFSSCQKDKVKNVDFTVSVYCEDKALEAEGIEITIVDANQTKFTYKTDAKGQTAVSLPAGQYTWSASGKKVIEGTIYKYNGASTSPIVVVEGMGNVTINVLKVTSSAIIIKEAYVGGFTDGETQKTGIDTYIILYNNSPEAVDASDVVITYAAPYNSSGTNKYITEGVLSYEKADWIPAYGAIWWFTSSVTIPAYSQILVACFGAIDHTKTYAASVDLSKSDYYWMSNSGVTQYSNAKYTASENIVSTHYLTCYPFSTGNAWALSVSSPALYIGKMKSTAVSTLSQDTQNYDHTLGANAAFNVVKFPKANVIDAVEIWEESKVSSSNSRFSADINTGYTVLTNKAGHTSYRNVDKEATEALPENEGKLVTTYDTKLDPSGIDAEASIKNGAHIIYMDTNNSSKDFHQRLSASIK